MSRIESKDIKIDPDAVMEASIGELQQVAVVGIDNTGNFYIASSEGVPSCLFLLEMGKQTVMSLSQGKGH